MLRSACTAALTLFIATTAVAGDARHFKGLPADSLPQAMANLMASNGNLETLLQGELTPQVMHEIHQQTYTLENALARITTEVQLLADTLEAVHQASEHADPATVQQAGEAWLVRSKHLAH